MPLTETCPTADMIIYPEDCEAAMTEIDPINKTYEGEDNNDNKIEGCRYLNKKVTFN
jgi:hypothetical protein